MAVLTLFSPCPLHWYHLYRHSNITILRCLPDHTLKPATLHKTLHWHCVSLDPKSWIGDHVTVHFQPTHWHRGSYPSCISISKNVFVITLKMYCSCMLQWILNLMELCKSCCYAIKFLTLDGLTTAFMNVRLQNCLNCPPTSCSTVRPHWRYI
jgi:hypothetical protein